MLYIRIGNRLHHPLHLHGHKFEVLDIVAPDQSTDCTLFGCPLTSKYSSEAARREIEARPLAGVLKDTVNLPAGGGVVIRFPTTNPGAWFLHCHLDLHMEDGMGLILREGGEEATSSIALPDGMQGCVHGTQHHHAEHPACDCYLDTDASKGSQFAAPHRCSRSYLCMHERWRESGTAAVYAPGVS